MPAGVLLGAVLGTGLLAAAAPAPPAATRLTAAQMEALVKEVSGEVEAIRGLRFKTPVRMEILSGAEARASFKSKLEPRAEEQARHLQRAYVHMSLIPRSADLVNGYLDLAEKGVAGYYEPGSKTFYLLDHVAPDEVRSVIAHELTHALEDQHYDLGAAMKKAEDDDHATAILSVIEGSATVVMIAYLVRQEERSRTEFEAVERRRAKRVEGLKAAPSFTQRSLAMPYILGITFLLRGNLFNWIGPDGGVRIADIDTAYAHPPRSTRHILHPDEYWHAPERPRRTLSLPDLSPVLGTGWSRALEGCIGELGLSVLTGARVDLGAPEALLPTRWTHAAATGTVGDVFHHYVNGDRRATILLTRWETERDAEEFERALVNRGGTFFRYGVNFVLLAGDFGDRGEALATAALQKASFWSQESR